MRVYLIYGNQDLPCKVRSLPNRYKFHYLFNLKPNTSQNEPEEIFRWFPEFDTNNFQLDNQ